MSLRIRLSRGGAKKRPYYRIVVADSRRPRDGRYIERLGTYNPMVAKDHPERLKTNDERIKYWLGVGAKPSDRVARLISDRGLVEKPPIPEQTKQHLPRAKTLERQKEAEEAAKKAAEANLIARREETAAMRSQANTAKLLESNPTLMRLRELEVLEKIACESKLNVVLGEKGLADRVVNLL